MRYCTFLHGTPVAAAGTNLLITLTSSSMVCSQLSASSTSQHPERLKSPFTGKTVRVMLCICAMAKVLTSFDPD